MYEPKNLKLWTMPESYFGASWPDYYVFLSQHRDSDTLTRSNFCEALQELGGETDTVLIVRESHWAVGWVEWIAIEKTDERALEKADNILQSLEDYPVLNEQAFSELEYNEACDYWESLSLQERVCLCQECGINIFSARHAYLPPDDSGYLLEKLMLA